MKELEVFWVGEEPKETLGFHVAMISERHHPWWENWWPHGQIIGWEHTFVHEITHLLDCIANDNMVGPHRAIFRDGYRAAVICDAILESNESAKRVDINY